jgi:type I restriction enzyme, S subunit
MSEWKKVRLGEIADVRDGTHDSPKKTSKGAPLVTSKNIKNGQIDISNTYLISEHDFHIINKRSKVEQWDILFSMIGTIGECAIVKEEPYYAIKNVGLFKNNGNRQNARWIYYYLKSNKAQENITSGSSGFIVDINSAFHRKII